MPTEAVSPPFGTGAIIELIRRLCPTFFWAYAAECHMRSFIVASSQPSGGKVLDLSDRFEQIVA